MRVSLKIFDIKDTGYQYLVFNINGDYVVAPRISKDGTFYKTIE